MLLNQTDTTGQNLPPENHIFCVRTLSSSNDKRSLLRIINSNLEPLYKAFQHILSVIVSRKNLFHPTECIICKKKLALHLQIMHKTTSKPFHPQNTDVKLIFSIKNLNEALLCFQIKNL